MGNEDVEYHMYVVVGTVDSIDGDLLGGVKRG